MKKMIFLAISFLLLNVNDVSAQGTEYDVLKSRLEKIDLELNITTDPERKASLVRQKFLIRANLARLSSEICTKRSELTPLNGNGSSGCGKRKPGKIIKNTNMKVKVICPADRKFGYTYDRAKRLLTIKVCNGLNGKDGNSPKIKSVKIVELRPGEKPRSELQNDELTLYLPKAKDGEPGSPGSKITTVEVVQLSEDEKPRGEYQDGKLKLYLPKAKDGERGQDGKDGQAGVAGKDGDRVLPDWLKIWAGGWYLLSRGPAWRHNFGGMVGMGFVLVPERLDLQIEGGIGYEAQQQMLSVYAKGGLGINFHPMVGMNLSAFGNWNLNYRNLSEYEILGGSVGIYGLFFKHLRVSADLLLAQLRWPENGGIHKTFGVGGIFTIGYQF